jgi:hypothetical protein
VLDNARPYACGALLVARAEETHLSSGDATTPDEVKHQGNHCYYQQKVNQPTGNMERKKAQHPHHKQNHKQS